MSANFTVHCFASSLKTPAGFCFPLGEAVRIPDLDRIVSDEYRGRIEKISQF
jgi:hypothetical protein